MSDLHTAVITRSAFFANRVDAFARFYGLTNKTVVPHLMKLANDHGVEAITDIIDQVVPAELHSSNMPALNHN